MSWLKKKENPPLKWKSNCWSITNTGERIYVIMYIRIGYFPGSLLVQHEDGRVREMDPMHIVALEKQHE